MLATPPYLHKHHIYRNFPFSCRHLGVGVPPSLTLRGRALPGSLLLRRSDQALQAPHAISIFPFHTPWLIINPCLLLMDQKESPTFTECYKYQLLFCSA